jgi:hypothetical protein
MELAQTSVMLGVFQEIKDKFENSSKKLTLTKEEQRQIPQLRNTITKSMNSINEPTVAEQGRQVRRKHPE